MIPISSPIIAKNAKKYLTDCLTSGWVSSKGSYIKKFEDKFAKFIGTNYAVAVSSGTAAIHLALAALDIGPGEEVIIPTLTMIAAALPIIYVGATPVLVDSDPYTGNIDANRISEKITKRTKAVIVVHLNGYPSNMKMITKICKKRHIFLIEDAAEAHGAEYRMTDKRWKKVGSIGDIGCFSFYGNKIITAGEGGMITTNSKLFADRIQSLRNLARSPKKHFYHQEIAFAYRMSNLQAALGFAELEQVSEFLKRKRQITDFYNSLLCDIPGIQLPRTELNVHSVEWQYSFLVTNEAKITRDQLAEYLKQNQIETRNFVIPLHQQPAFLKKGLFKKESYPIAEYLSEHGISIPSGLAITNNEMHTVSRIIHNILL